MRALRLVVVSLLIAGTLAGLLAPARAATDPYAGLKFTKSVDDAKDYPPFGFSDILGVSFAEPGDKTLVVRIDVADPLDVPPAGSVDVFFTVAGANYRGSVQPDLTAAAPFGKCVLDGPSIDCIVKYADIKAKAGDTLTTVRAISYVGSAQDYAPGGLYVPDGFTASVLGLYGTDYKLQGSTATAAANTTTAAPTSSSAKPTSSAPASSTTSATAPTNTSAPATTSAPPTSNATQSSAPSMPAAKKSPGPVALVTAVAVAVAALARRRRE